jgi:hypothetical protein
MEVTRSVTTTTILLFTYALLIIPTMSESETLIPDKGVYDDAIAKRTPTFDTILYE